MTTKQVTQFNKMLVALKRIGKGYDTVKQLRKDSTGRWGLDFEEALEMSYENLQLEARLAIRGIKAIIK